MVIHALSLSFRASELMAVQPTPESDIKEVGEKLILIKPHQSDLKWTNWAVGEQREREGEK